MDRNAFLAELKTVVAPISYVKRRLLEKGTWAAVSVAVVGAAALPKPWNYVFIAVGVIGAIVPSP